MTGAPPPPPSSSGREALMVWLKFLALLGLLFAFGWTIFHLTRSLQ